jgi:hypothetical protein
MKKWILYLGATTATAVVAGYNHVWSVECFDDGTTTAWIGTAMETGMGIHAAVTIKTWPNKQFVVEWRNSKAS